MTPIFANYYLGYLISSESALSFLALMHCMPSLLTQYGYGILFIYLVQPCTGHCIPWPEDEFQDKSLPSVSVVQLVNLSAFTPFSLFLPSRRQRCYPTYVFVETPSKTDPYLLYEESSAVTAFAFPLVS